MESVDMLLNPDGSLFDWRLCVDGPLEIAFDDLRADDEVFIETENSYYTFTVTSPVDRQGLLSGGSLEFRSCEATLLGTLGRENDIRDMSQLRTGARAVFCVEDADVARRVITSRVTDLFRLRPSGELN